MAASYPYLVDTYIVIIFGNLRLMQESCILFVMVKPDFSKF